MSEELSQKTVNEDCGDGHKDEPQEGGYDGEPTQDLDAKDDADAAYQDGYADGRTDAAIAASAVGPPPTFLLGLTVNTDEGELSDDYGGYNPDDLTL